MKIAFLILTIIVSSFSLRISGYNQAHHLQDQGVARYESVLQTMSNFAEQAGLTNLREHDLPRSATEIRIWMGGGLITSRCLILKIQNHRRGAYFVNAKRINSRHEPIYVRTALGLPRSGWDSLIEYLKSTGVNSPRGFVLDKTFEPGDDQEMVVIEVKTNGHYSMAFYLDSTQSEDGKKALGLCRKVEDEFARRIGCSY